MWELYHGGWLAPNIYFLGHAGCVRVKGISIAGASGIFKAHDFRQGNYERQPYTSSSLRSIYHIREFNVRQLSLLSQPTIGLSHDWPQSIEHHGNLRSLLSRKTFLRQDVNNGTLGSPPLMGLLRTLKPTWWFAAHLHVRYEATFIHEPALGFNDEMESENKMKNPDEIVIDDTELDGDFTIQSSTEVTLPLVPAPPKQNPDEIVLDDEEEVVEAPPAPPISAPTPGTLQAKGPVTRFLALDKCLPKRQFLEIVDIPTPVHMAIPDAETTSSSMHSPPVLEFDPEWLAITRAFHPWFSITRQQPIFPDEAEARIAVSTATQWIIENLQKNDPTRTLPVNDIQTFIRTAPEPISPSPNQRVNERDPQPPAYLNPQTEAFCRMIGIENKINPGVSSGDCAT